MMIWYMFDIVGNWVFGRFVMFGGGGSKKKKK